MTSAQMIVTMAGLIAISATVWFFWLKRSPAAAANTTDSGAQEATILVKDGYSPSRILVKHDQPIRLTFQREEANPCSEMVIFDAFHKSAKLPQGEPVTLDLVAHDPGEYPFTCQMGMYRGILVVE